MENTGPTDFDNLSKFENELKEIEGREGGVKDPAQADEVRGGLIAAMRGVFKSHYVFAVELDRYHGLYKAKKVATAAMERIATASGCSARTLYRLLSNYDNARQLPLVFVDVMKEQGIDPVRTANRPLVNELVVSEKPSDHEKAKASLEAARAKVIELKSAARATPVDVRENREAAQNPAAAPEPATHEEAKVSQRAVRAKVVKVKPPAQTTPTNMGGEQQAVQNLATASEPSSSEEAKIPQPVARVKAPKIEPAVQTFPSEAEEFSMCVVRMFQERFGAYDGEDRDDQIRLVFERVVNVLHADVHELHLDDRPDHGRTDAKTTL